MNHQSNLANNAMAATHSAPSLATRPVPRGGSRPPTLVLLLSLAGLAVGCTPDPCESGYSDDLRITQGLLRSIPVSCPDGGDETTNDAGSNTATNATECYDTEDRDGFRSLQSPCSGTGTGTETATDTAGDTANDATSDTAGDTAVDTTGTASAASTGTAGDTTSDTADDTTGTASDASTGTAGDTTGDTTGTGSDASTGADSGTDTGGQCIANSPPASGPDLLTAASFAVLAGATVTNANMTVLIGDLGVSPGTALVGFPPGAVIGTSHSNDAIAVQAQTDLTAAYIDAANRPGATPLPADVSGMTLVPGVYSAAASLQIASDDLTLDGGGDPNATWIFQVGTTLVTSSGADVILSDGGCGRAANVFWQVGSSATLGTGTDFIGTIMADQSIAAASGVTVDGRLLARIGAVTLDNNQVAVP